MTAIATDYLFSGDCLDCDSPKGAGYVCEACAKDREEEHGLPAIRRWLTRARTVAPGLTHAEVAVVERLIQDLEA